MIIFKKLLKKYRSLNVVVKASIWFTVCSFIQKGISIISMPIFTRLLTTSEYGNYSIYVSWYQFFLIFITLNINKEIFNKGLIENDKSKDEYTTNQMGLMLVLGLFFFLLYMLFHNRLNSLTGLSFILGVFLIIEVVSNGIISLWTSLKRFCYDYKKILIVTLLISILNPILGIVLVSISDYKVEARVLSVIIVPILISIFLLLFYSRKGKYFSDISSWKKTIINCFPLLPHYLSLVLLNQADKLMINYFYGSSIAAIYSIAHTAGLLMVLVNDALNNSFVPWAYNKLKNNKSYELKKMVSSLLYIVLFANIFLILIAPECIRILAAPEYKDAIWCVVPIAVSVYCTFVYTLFVDIEVFYNGNIFVTISSVIAALLNIMLNYLFVPRFGYIAAAYTTLVSYLFTMIMHYIFMIYLLNKSERKQDMFNVKEILFVFILLICFSLLSLLTYNYFLIRYIFIIAFVLLIFINKKKISKIIKKIRMR